MKIIKYLKYIVIYYTFIIILTLFLSFMQLIGLSSSTLISMMATIILSIFIFIMSFINGKSSINKGYICGIKYGIINILLLFIPGILIYETNIAFIYYLIILLITIMGSMYGKTKKKDESN